MWRTDTIAQLDADAVPLVVAQSGFEDAASDVIGIIIGFGIVLAVLSILIIAGKMVAANFQRIPRWASRGMDDLPWVLLAVCLMLVAVPIVTVLLSGSKDDGVQEWDDMLDGVEPGDLGEDPGVPPEDEEEEEEDEEEDDGDDEEDEDEEEEEEEEDDPGDLPPEEQI